MDGKQARRTAHPNALDTDYLDFVTGLRGLAAFFVMLSHVWYQIWPAVPEPFGYGRRPEGMIGWLTGWLYYGHFGVIVFIVLSGFCLMLPVVNNENRIRGGALAFLRRRAWRIVPPYYSAMAVSLVLIWLWIGEKTGSQWDISIPVTLSGLISHLLLLQDFVEVTQINYVFWSIAVEFHLYLLFPALVWAKRNYGMNATAIAFCGAVYGTILLLEVIGYHEIPPQFIGLCAYFMFGMVCADMFSRMRRCSAKYEVVPWNLIVLVLTAFVVILSAIWGMDVAERRFAFLDTICAMATVALLMSLGCSSAKDLMRGMLESRIMVKLGVFSYSLYLIHAPLLQLVWQYAVSSWLKTDAYQFIALTIFGVPISLAGAYVFFLVCEQPFLVKKAFCATHGVASPAHTVESP